MEKKHYETEFFYPHIAESFDFTTNGRWLMIQSTKIFYNID